MKPRNTPPRKDCPGGRLALGWLISLTLGSAALGQVYVAVEVSYPGGAVASSIGSAPNRDLPPLRRSYERPSGSWPRSAPASRAPAYRPARPGNQVVTSLRSTGSWRVPAGSDAVVCYVSRPNATGGDAPIASIHPPQVAGTRGTLPRRRYESPPIASRPVTTHAISTHPVTRQPVTQMPSPSPRRRHASTPRHNSGPSNRAATRAVDRLEAHCDEDFRQLEQLLDANLSPTTASELIEIVTFVLHADLMDLGATERESARDAYDTRDLLARIDRWRHIAERLQPINGASAGNVLAQLDRLEQQMAALVADGMAEAIPQD